MVDEVLFSNTLTSLYSTESAFETGVVYIETGFEAVNKYIDLGAIAASLNAYTFLTF